MVEVKKEEFVDVKIEPETKPSVPEDSQDVDNSSDSQPLADADDQPIEDDISDDNDVDDKGVPYKNRFMESERKRKNLEEENEIYRKQHTPAPSPPQTQPQPAYNQPVYQQPQSDVWEKERRSIVKSYVDAGYEPEHAQQIANTQIESNQSMNFAAMDYMYNSLVKPIEQRSSDAIHEAKVETIAAKNPELADFADETMKIIRNTPVQNRNYKGFITDAFALARGRDIDSIREKAVVKGRGEAIKEKRIVKEVSSPGAMRADKSGNVRMSTVERNFLQKSADMRGISFQEALKQNLAMSKK